MENKDIMYIFEEIIGYILLFFTLLPFLQWAFKELFGVNLQEIIKMLGG